MIVATVYDKETIQGKIGSTDLVFTTRGATADEYSEVKLIVPASTGAFVLEEILTPEGWIDDYPNFYMTFRFQTQDAFFDSNNDGYNELTTNLLSINLTATITEVEATSGPIETMELNHIKGSFEGTAYFNAFLDEPPLYNQKLIHTVTGEFEYYFPFDL